MKRFAYLDIEANHDNWSNPEIIEIAFIIKDEEGHELDHFQSLIKPHNEINPEIVELTGISDYMLTSAPEFHEVANRVYDKLDGSIIVAHKAEFDYNILQLEFSKLNLKLTNKTICTLSMSQRLIPELKSYSLKSLCHLIQVPLKRHHRAYDDAFALAHLHKYLRLINGEIQKQEEYLSSHKKLIDKTPTRPGVLVFTKSGQQEVFKTENLQLKLKELLLCSPKNKHRLTSDTKVKILPTSTVIRAGLKKVLVEKTIYPFCLYKIKDKSGKIILKVGKTNLKMRALYFFKTKKEAYKLLNKIIKSTPKVKLAYQDPAEKSKTAHRENIEITQRLKKLIAFEKNYLIRSAQKFNGLYQYTIIKGEESYANFDSPQLINKSELINYDKIKLKKIGPREYMSLNHSLFWIKNQKNKTDLIMEIKQAAN